MRKDFIVNSLIVMFVGVVVVAAVVSADTTGVVTATVTAQNIAITVSDNSVSFGTLGLNSSKTTNQLAPDDTQLAVNTGNVAAVFNILATSSPTWFITTDDTNNDSNEFKLKWATDGGTIYTGLTYGYGLLATGVTALSTVNVDLEVTTPVTTTDYTQQSSTVTIQVTTP